MNELKEEFYDKIIAMNDIPPQSFAVVELIGGCLQRTHRKRMKGGVCVRIDNALKESQHI